jgi:predicted N-acetyltransferase YhbS
VIRYKQLHHSDLDGLNCIDRSDYSDTWCVVSEGKIKQKQRVFNHPGFSSTQWEHVLSKFAREIQNNETLIFGAFDRQLLVGLAGLEIDTLYGPEKNMLNVGPVWISKSYRRQGIGTRLMQLVENAARKRNVTYLYISATPVPGTVEFYKRIGCVLLHNPDPELFTMEPEDIHMVLTLQQMAADE